MTILNFIKKKYIRLQGSRNVLKLNYFIEKNLRDEKLVLTFQRNPQDNLLFKILLI